MKWKVWFNNNHVYPFVIGERITEISMRGQDVGFWLKDSEASNKIKFDAAIFIPWTAVLFIEEVP
jgi:hypothetical protein